MVLFITTNMMRCLIIKAIEMFARSEEPIIAFELS